MDEKTCCFLGHRKINVNDELCKKVRTTTEHLIVNEKVETFLFGNKSQFNDLCYEIVSELKNIYPHIKRVYVRAQFPHITADYLEYLLESYEETYFPQKMLNAGRASYVERNMEMTDKSKFCIMYFDKNYTPSTNKNSGTKFAYEYAVKKNKKIINLFDNK